MTQGKTTGINTKIKSTKILKIESWLLIIVHNQLRFHNSITIKTRLKRRRFIKQTENRWLLLTLLLTNFTAKHRKTLPPRGFTLKPAEKP